MRKLTALITGWLLASAALGASFNCGKAATAVERLICENHDVGMLDEDLADAYHDALKGSPDKQLTRQEQQRWLSDVRDVCSDASCLKVAYQARIDALNRDIVRQEAPLLPPSLATGREPFIGSWDGSSTASYAIYGTLHITRTYLMWRRNGNYPHACRLSYQMQKPGNGVVLHDAPGLEAIANRKRTVAQYVLKITSDNCNTGLSYVRITFRAPDGFGGFDFTEYDRERRVQGWMGFSQSNPPPRPPVKIDLHKRG